MVHGEETRLGFGLAGSCLDIAAFKAYFNWHSRAFSAIITLLQP